MEKFKVLKESMDHPDFKNNFEEFLNGVENIGEGGNANVSTWEDDPNLKNICYKKLKPDPQVLWNDLEREFDNQEKVYNAGIRSPKPYIILRNTITREEYFLMERIAGLTIAEMIAGQKILPENFDLKVFMSDLRSQMEKMHKAGIFHRDFHTKNVMVTPGGLPVIIDFGTAYEGYPGQEEGEFIYDEAVMLKNPSTGKYENKSGYFMKDSEALKGIELAMKEYVNKMNGFIQADQFGQAIDKR